MAPLARWVDTGRPRPSKTETLAVPVPGTVTVVRRLPSAALRSSGGAVPVAAEHQARDHGLEHQRVELGRSPPVAVAVAVSVAGPAGSERGERARQQRAGCG